MNLTVTQSPEIPSILWDLNANYPAQNNPPLNPNLSHINPDTIFIQ
jgi:hypothetical protein